MSRLRQGWPAYLVAVAAGALLTASFAPFYAWPLAIVSIGLLLWLIEDQPPGRAALRGWCFGLGLFGSGASWVYVSIHIYGNASHLLAGFLTALFCLGLAFFVALPCVLYALLPARRWWQFPSLWTLGEWFRSWFLTGFPWLITGTSQVDGPLSGWLPLLGVFGSSLLLAFIACALQAAVAKKIAWPAALGIMLAIILVAQLLKTIDWTQMDGRALNVALVQGNVPQELKWVPGRLEQIMALYPSLSTGHWNGDILVWPEAAIPAARHRVNNYLQRMDAAALNGGSSLLLGIPSIEQAGGQRRYYNSVIGLGRAAGQYFKQRLVPFGEYVPLESWLRGAIDFFDLPSSHMNPGPADQPPLKAGRHRIPTFICYEIVYPDLVARGSRAGSLLLTVSNDTWFGASLGPIQHLQIARVRALETQKPLLRATNNGISALIDHHGEIITRGPQFAQAVITGEIQPMSGITPFARTGSWPILLLCTLILLAAPLTMSRAQPRGIGR